MNKHSIHRRLKNVKYKSNKIISQKCHLVISRLYFIASIGSNHLSITANIVNFNLTEIIIHGIINRTNHNRINIQNNMVHNTHFRILSRVIHFQKFLTLASIPLIKSNQNEINHKEKIIHITLYIKLGNKDSHFISNIADNIPSNNPIPNVIAKIISDISKNVHALPSVHEIFHHSLRISENLITFVV